jgi:hypothetical protein
MPKTEADSPLTPKQLADLAKIIDMYIAQAERCVRGDAPLASCVMVGATVEASDFLTKHGRPNHKPYLEKQGYALLERLSTEVHSLIRLIPGGKYFPKDLPEIWDFPSFAVLARHVLEDSVIFLYLVEPGLLADELDFRRIVWEYHSAKEGSKIASLYIFVTVRRSESECQLRHAWKLAARKPHRPRSHRVRRSRFLKAVGFGRRTG